MEKKTQILQSDTPTAADRDDNLVWYTWNTEDPIIDNNVLLKESLANKGFILDISWVD